MVTEEDSINYVLELIRQEPLSSGKVGVPITAEEIVPLEQQLLRTSQEWPGRDPWRWREFSLLPPTFLAALSAASAASWAELCEI